MFQANPITVKELRVRMRGIRAILPMMAYQAVLAVIVLITFGSIETNRDFSILANSGRQLGFAFLIAQVILVLILAPAYAASAIAIEKERETFGVMLTTLLRPWDIVSGKVFTGFSYATLIVLSSMPMMSLVFWLGGFDLTHLFWGFMVITATALITTCTGIFFSTLFKRSYVATGVTYGVVFGGIAINYLIIGIVSSLRQALAAGSASFNFDTIPVWISYTLNPFEMIRVIQENGVQYALGNYYRNPIIDSIDQWLASYGVSYIVLHILFVIALSFTFLIFAGKLLFRSSREDAP